MSARADELLQEALALPETERLHLGEALLSSVDPYGELPFDPEWLAEVVRRASRIDSGESKLSSWPEVRDSARASLKAKSDG